MRDGSRDSLTPPGEETIVRIIMERGKDGMVREEMKFDPSLYGKRLTWEVFVQKNLNLFPEAARERDLLGDIGTLELDPEFGKAIKSIRRAFEEIAGSIGDINEYNEYFLEYYKKGWLDGTGKFSEEGWQKMKEGVAVSEDPLIAEHREAILEEARNERDAEELKETVEALLLRYGFSEEFKYKIEPSRFKSRIKDEMVDKLKLTLTFTNGKGRPQKKVFRLEGLEDLSGEFTTFLESYSR